MPLQPGDKPGREAKLLSRILTIFAVAFASNLLCGQTSVTEPSDAGPKPDGGASLASFVTGYALGGQPLRNDFSGWVGMKLTVGANPLTISSLGRICVSGNSQAHNVKLVNASDGSDLAGAAGSVSMAGCAPAQFIFTAIDPVTLPAGTSYYLVTQETQNGDRWYDQGPVSATNVAAINSSVYAYNGKWYPLNSGNTSYVPPTFQYSVVIPTPITVTLAASPAGPSFTVDGSTSTAPQTLSWTGGTSHTISTTSPQSAGAGTQNVWSGWSDGGTLSHTVAPASNTTYTANFTTQYQLTSNSSPAGAGTIAANLPSTGGYYNSGTSVQLTATPAFGCTFQNWGGALSGVTNPQLVTMSGPQTVTANFQCSGPPSTGFVTGYALNNPSLRSDFTGWAGMKLTIGPNPLSVSSLGRICVTGNATAHIVKFVNAGDSSDVPGASVLVNMVGCQPNQFAYAAITPVTLPAGASYYLVSQESYGGDRWYDQGAISAKSDAAVNSAAYFYSGAWYPAGSANTSYVPPNFQYSVVPPAQITVNVGANPAGVSFSVDGTTYTTPQVLLWTSGTSHTILTTTPQSVGAGTQNLWSGWSDGGAISHTVVPASNITYTANFTTQYLLTTSVSPPGGGSITASLPSTGGYYNSGTSVQLTATPASGCTFFNWNGNTTMTANPLTVTMSGPQNIFANFQCGTPPTPGCGPGVLPQALQQLTKTMTYLNTSQFPLATDSKNSNQWGAGSAAGWTSGFFPGLIWHMYEQTLNPSLLARAQAQTTSLAGELTDASSHDVGFRIMSSYGNGYRITGDPSYMSAIQTAASTLATLYQPGAGVINSWPYYSSNINVIIDNMMNLELLFYAAQKGGNSAWYGMAVSHALQTMQNNVRPDSSTYQGVEYNTNGGVISKFTSDGYSTNSTWSRGQAWGIYGFTMTYRYTRDPRFLAAAQQLANYFIQNLPADFVPYWDFSQTAPAPRDSSAAAIAAAGLLELSTYVSQPYQSTYYNAALSIQSSLSSLSYLGSPANTDGILLHGAYSVPANADIDTSLIWGDYYFVRGCYAAMSPPPAPTNPAVSSFSPGQINLTWNAQSGAIRYSVKRSTTSGGPYVTISPPPILTANSFADTSVAANATYYYVVSAISVAGESANSAEVQASLTTQALLLTTAVSPAGSGGIAASPSSTGGYYTAGTSVQLTATPASGCTFVNWTGSLTGTSNPQTLTMSAASNVTANFQCTASAPVFLTGYALSGQSLRNDFTGWVGMKLTVGASALSVSSLGRICVSNNVQTHTVKFVNAGTGNDVAGASASVNMAGCSTGQFVYSSISPLTLPAGTSYYLVTQETQNGDRWYDQGAVSATTDATVNSSVYFYSGNWIPVNSANTSYAPPNFKYSVISPAPITVNVAANPAGPSFTVDGTAYTAAQILTWTGGTPHTISTTSPQSAGVGVQYVWSGWSDGGAISHTVSPTGGMTFNANFASQYLLNTSVSPVGGGTVNAIPSPASGYYDAGTPVQLTAIPASGCTFSGWSGGLSGTANPQTVTMANPQSVAAAFQCAAPPASTSFITAFALNTPTLRRDFNGWVGMKLTVSGIPLTVSALGRICVAGNSQTHMVKLANASDGTDVPGASVAVNMAGCTPGQFAYGTISPVTLPIGASYYLASQETQGGDLWYDQGRVSSTNAGAVNSAVYFYAGNWIAAGGGNTSYVPPNFQYTIPSTGGGPPADLSAYWSFDTNYVSGSILIDQSSYANNAAANSLTYVPGKIGRAIQLDGSLSHASVPNGSHLDLMNDLTLAVWVKTTNSSRTEAILSKYDAGGSEYGYILRTNPAGTVEVQFGASNIASGNRVVTDPTKINDGQWHQIAVVVKLGSSVSFYIDGVPSSTTALATLAVAAGPDFQIGLNPYTYYGNYFTGSIDEVRVYSRVLSASEIYALYNPSASGAGGPPAVSINSPANAAQVGGVITLSANASSSAGIYYVQFLLDGVGILPGVASPPYSALWDTTHASSGPHTLTALVTDNAGHSTTSTGVNITVTNPPVVSGGLPIGLWPAGSNQLTLSVGTNEPASCRYSNLPGTGYLGMTGFSTSGGTTHSTALNGLQNGQTYNFYVRCQDSFSNVDNADYTVSFSIAAQNFNNGLAQTPPMGWNPWNHFREQISDTLIRQTADAIVSSGMRDAGYTYVVIDGGWEAERDGNGVLHPNSNFPDMKALADYVHSKGLKLGIYSSPGPLTCDSLPGSYGYVQQDANLFAQWGIDYLKYDLCSASMIYPSSQLPVVYKLMGDALNATGRPIMYSICEYGEDHVWSWGASAGGNLWRSTSDILDNWNTMSGIGFSQTSLYPYGGPGHWNDPDMLEIGNGGMTSDEYRTHFSLWSILAAPLMAGNDVRGMTQDTISILLNTDVIAVDQDAAGIQGHQLSVSGNQEIWVKPLSGGAVAVGLFNRDSQAANMSVQLNDLGLSGNVSARDLWAHQSVAFQGGGYQASVPPHGVVMLRITPAP